jgi:cyclopropane fatty-acyl-phospholipid synthase-like methyltransferase
MNRYIEKAENLFSDGIQCTNCGSRKIFFIKENQFKYYEKRFSLYECVDCGYWFSPENDKSYISNQMYFDYLKSVDSETCIERYSRLNELLMEGIQSIVEIGCGPGGVLELIKNNYPDKKIAGLELCEELRRHVQKEKKIDCFSSWEQLGLSADLLYANHVIEHFEHPKLFFDLIENIGAKSHSLQLSFPNRECYWVKRGFFPDLHLPNHRFYFSIKQICSLLNDFGYSVKSVKTSEKNRYFSNLKACMYNHYRGELDAFKKVYPKDSEWESLKHTIDVGAIENRIEEYNLGSEAIIIASK